MAPPRSLVAQLATEVTNAPVRSVRALTGGISNWTYLVRFAAPSSASPVVVRVLSDPARARTEAAALRALAESDIPAPRLLWNGRVAGLGSTVVTSRVPGRPIARPQDTEWIRGLAAVLAAIHRVTPAGRGLNRDPGAARPWLDGPPPPALGNVARRVWPAVRAHRDALTSGSPVLVHGDYHAGNVHWVRGRVAGVIDWEMARWGPPAADVTYAYMDLVLAAGRREADRFLDSYVAVAAPVEGFDAWLLLATLRPLPDPAGWLPSYEGAGYSGLTATLLRRRLSRLVQALTA